jgi:hypothetical protein
MKTEAEKVVDIAKNNAASAIETAKGESQSKMLRVDADAYELLKRAESEAKALELKREQLTPMMIQQSWVEAWKAGGAKVPTFIMSGSSANTGMLWQTPSIKEMGEMQ